MTDCNLRSCEMSATLPRTLPLLRRFQLAIAGLLARAFLLSRDDLELCMPKKSEAKVATSLPGFPNLEDQWIEAVDEEGDSCRYKFTSKEYSNECDACVSGCCTQKVVDYGEFGQAVIHDCGDELN